jgi:hypothetical protein
MSTKSGGRTETIAASPPATSIGRVSEDGLRRRAADSEPLEISKDKVKSVIDQVSHDTFSYLVRLQGGGWSKVLKSRLFGLSTDLYILYHDEVAEAQKACWIHDGKIKLIF